MKRYVIQRDDAMPVVYNTVEEPSNASANIVFEEGQVIEANPLVRPLQGQPLKTSYLKIRVKANPSDKPIDVCLDTSSSTNLVDKDWISKWVKNLRWINIDPRFMNGVKSRTKIDKQVEFNLYIPGKVNGIPVDGHFHVRADIIEGLGPKMLVGTNFIIEHGVKIDISSAIYTIWLVFSIKVQGEVIRRIAYAITRRVCIAKDVIIPPRSIGNVLL